jgi:hypothetical protein
MARKRAAGRGLQKRGGTEERVSRVGRARARAERREARYDPAPGPGSEELLLGPKGPRKPRRKRVSRIRRGGPAGLEPEDKASTRRRRRHQASLPWPPDEPPIIEGEVPVRG